MTQNIKNKLVVWEKVAVEYSKVLVPNQPSQDDCKNYGVLIANVLKNKKKPRIMIMGATPQLRRVLYTYEFLQKADVFCVDLNPAMFKAMTNFLATGRQSREKYVRASWLQTRFPDQYFDLVVGDEVICNVNLKLHKKLFGEISRILKKDGAWVTRHNVYLTKDKNASDSKILIRLAGKIIQGEYDFQLAANILSLEILYFGSATKMRNDTMRQHLKIMRREYNQNLKKHKYSAVIAELLNFFEDNFVSMVGDYQWFILSEKASEAELKKFFTIEKKVYSEDHDFVKNGPIYTLKRN